jgi:hypothetical protein
MPAGIHHHSLEQVTLVYSSTSSLRRVCGNATGEQLEELLRAPRFRPPIVYGIGQPSGRLSLTRATRAKVGSATCEE